MANLTNNTPDEFICPITLDKMEDPVICSDGHTYERQAILSIRGSHSPMTRELIDKTKLIPNRALKNCILRYNEEIQNAAAKKAEAEIELATKKAELEAEYLDKLQQIQHQPVQVLEQVFIQPNNTRIISIKHKHMFYITSSLSLLSSLLEGIIDKPKNFVKTILDDFYDKIHSSDIDILEHFNNSLKEKLKYLESTPIINKTDMSFLVFSTYINIDIIIELFSIIGIDGSFMLMFYSENFDILDYTNIKIVLHEFTKLIKYIIL